MKQKKYYSMYSIVDHRYVRAGLNSKTEDECLRSGLNGLNTTFKKEDRLNLKDMTTKDLVGIADMFDFSVEQTNYKIHEHQISEMAGF